MKRLLTTGAAVLVLCLTYLLPASAVAQQLTRYEYWFDNNVGSRHAGTLSGSTADIDLDIDTDGLNDGLHVLHLRVRRSDGKYSSIMSSTFLKFFTGRVTMMEYWVDNDLDGAVRLPCTPHSSGSGIVLNADLDLKAVSPGMHRLNYRGVSDGGTAATAVNSSYFLKRLDGTVTMIEYWVDDNRDGAVRLQGNTASTGNAMILNADLDMKAVSPGMHRLNYRGVSEGQAATAINSSYFLKRLDGTVTMIEYWVDNDIDNAVRLPGTTASTGNGIVLNADLDLKAVSPGMHRLNYRGVSDGGQAASAVASSYFFKTLTGEVKMLEYWVDNRQNVKRTTLQAGSSANSLIYNGELDLGSVSPGMHRLYYRGVSSGQAATSVGVEPVMVKSLYADQQQEAVNVVNYSMTIDDETPIVAAVNNPRKEVSITRELDVHDLAPGEHRVTVQAWNSASMSVSDGSTFTVPQPSTAPPTVGLTAQVNGGLVTLKFNSVPNLVKWKLIRIDANGSSATVKSGTQGSYPNAITVNDDPYNGPYTYKTRVYYKDATGAQKYVTSNDVNVTVNGDKVAYGYISGRVFIDSATVNSWIPWDILYTIGNSNEVEEKETDNYGEFMYSNIPVNTRVIINAKAHRYSDKGYIFEPVEIVIKEGKNDVELYGRWDEDVVRDSYGRDLQIASYVEFQPGGYMKFKVKNITRLPWTGRISLYSVKKAYLKNHPDGEMPDITPTGSVGTGSVADIPTYSPYSDYNYDYSDMFSLSAGASKEIIIPNNLSSMRGDDDEMYCFFLNSIDEDKREKPLATNSSYNFQDNPFEQLVERNLVAQGEQQVFWEEVDYAVDLVEAICRYTKKFDGLLEKSERSVTFLTESIEKQFTYDAMLCNSFSELVQKYPRERTICVTYDKLMNGDGNNVVHAWRDSIARFVRFSGGALKVIKGMKNFVDNLELANDIWKNYNAMEVAAFAARKLIDMSENEFPFAKVLKTYLDVTEKSVHNVLDLVDYYDQLYQYQDFRNDKYKFVIKINKKHGGSFDASTVKNAIDKVEIFCSANSNDGSYDALFCTSVYNPETEWDPLTGTFSKHCYLKRTDIDDNYDSEAFYTIRDMRMTIYWKNGRISHVPLRNGNGMQGNGVKYSNVIGTRTYTITYNSMSREDKHCADIIKLDD